MTSKTFKNRVSVRDAESVLEITDTPAGIRITVREEDRIVSGWFNPVQGAGISLAILEAAGHKEAQGNETTEAAHHFGMSMLHLRLGIKEQEYITAEAEAQAKLEAEALELFKASGAYGSDRLFLKFSDLEETTQSAWLAVARCARELAKEATK